MKVCLKIVLYIVNVTVCQQISYYHSTSFSEIININTYLEHNNYPRVSTMMECSSTHIHTLRFVAIRYIRDKFHSTIQNKKENQIKKINIWIRKVNLYLPFNVKNT